MPHDADHAAKQDSSAGSRADRFAASHHERRSCYVFGAGMSAEAKALLGQVVFNDPKGFGAYAMEFGQFRARDLHTNEEREQQRANLPPDRASDLRRRRSLLIAVSDRPRLTANILTHPLQR